MTLLYRIIRPLARLVLSWYSHLTVSGVENIPSEGPFILLPNHQSLLDPFLVQGVCPRGIHSMTKSTQFASFPMRVILLRILGFPVRRYRIDPQSVRVLLRLLDEGRGVCVYPEGERSWDGALQPFRRGTLRVLLRAGAPVIPVGIEGGWDVWPRWSRRPRPGRAVHLRFGAPITPEPIRSRKERERRLPEFERELRERLLELSGEARLRSEGTILVRSHEGEVGEEVPANPARNWNGNS